MSPTRLIAIVGALAGGAGLALQFYLMQVSMAPEGFSPLAITWRYLGYFTLLTNLFVFAIWVRAALRPDVQMPRLEAAGAVSIIMVGIIYHALLASRWNPQGAQLVADFTHHTFVPILFAIYWLMRPHGRLRWIDAFALVLWPLAYCPYALIRGAFDGWYAYFFLDPRHMSLVQLTSSIAGLAGVFLVCAFMLIGIDKMLAKRAPSLATSAA